MAPKYLSTSKVYNISGTLDDDENTDKAVYDADFERAISATKFGKFNVILFLISIPAGWTAMFETTTMSFVFPAAHCDLDLTLNQRGSLNAITFVGMVTSGFAWGYLCDTLGRKKLMVIGFLLDGVFVILSSFAQNFTLLLVSKFFGGLIVNGPFAALTSYLSEFHCSKFRSRVQLARAMIVSLGSLVLPMLAWAILPHQYAIQVFGKNVVLHSWNIFLLLSAIPSITSGILFISMPESPKFLMTVGRNDKALEVFQRVYTSNTGKSKEEFPIKSLVDEIGSAENKKHGGQITANRGKIQALREGFRQIKPLCFSPHIKNIFLVCTIQSMYMLSLNTLRLWLPQIFQSISDYQYFNNGTTSSLCSMLKTLDPGTEANATCYVNFSPSVYMNSMIIAAVSICGYIIAGSLINKLGKKMLLGTLSIVCGIMAMAMYLAQNLATIITLSSLFLSLGGICGNVVITIVIDLFPTSLRTVTISLVMMLGRSASMIGNLVFPILLSLGCAPAFFSIGSIVIACSLLAILLPNTDLKALK